MIVADTGAVIALLDADDRHHEPVLELYDRTGDRWLLPWAILPEVDYLLTRHAGADAANSFHADLAEGAWEVEWGEDDDLARAHRLLTRYADLRLGLVDAVVMAVAERLGAEAVVTLDVRDFGAVELAGAPALWPRDGAG